MKDFKAIHREEIVREIKFLMVSLNTKQRLSDDMDMYYVEKAGFSPMLEAQAKAGRKIDRAAVLSDKLLDAGEEAAEAVAEGLRMQGLWREKLLHYARVHRTVTVIREALKLVSRRRVDPLDVQAAKIMAGEKT